MHLILRAGKKGSEAINSVKLTACLFVSVLTIIELQNDIRDLQKKAANETTGDHIKGQSVLNANVTIQSDII